MTIVKPFDAVEDALLKAYQMNKNGRRRVQVKMDQFKNITLIEIITGNVKHPDEVKIRVRLFWNGDEMLGARETWGYNLDREQRCPIISKMMFEGYTQQRISEMFQVHASTIHKDVRYMRDHTVLLDGYEFRPGHAQTKTATRRKAAPNEHRVVH